MNGLIGRKLGMTQIYSDSGEAIPVTVIDAGPCPVVQVKAAAKGRQRAAGIRQRKAKHASKAQSGHAQAAGLETIPSVLRDFALVKVGMLRSRGETVTVGIFAPGDPSR